MRKKAGIYEVKPRKYVSSKWSKFWEDFWGVILVVLVFLIVYILDKYTGLNLL